MAGSITITTQSPMRGPPRPVSKVSLAWTSDASGNVSSNPTGYLGGELLRVVFVPGSGGSAPTNAYDITLLDENSVDVLSGLGANLSNTTTVDKCPGVTCTDGTTPGSVPRAVDDILTLNVSNAGNTKTGTVVLYLR